jgi:hypothetical protein
VENVRHLNRDRDAADGAGGFERVPPQDLDAEQAVLGAMFYGPQAIDDAAAVMDPADHYRPAHETIHRAILALHAAGEPVDPVLLGAYLGKTGELARVGGTAYLHTLASAGHLASLAQQYAEIVHEKAVRRRVVEAGLHIAQLGYSDHGDLTQLVNDVRKHTDDATVLTGPRGGSVDALLAEMLTSSALDDMPALEPLVGDLLHLDTLARIIGPSGHMKSFMTIDIAAHVGTGLPWHGQYVRPGTVVYLVAEGARGIRKRVRAWEQHHGLVMDNVLFLPRPVQAMSPEWDTLIAALKRVGPALIVVDTQARVSVGVEENSNSEMGIVVERMDDLRRATGACVLLIHHTGHIGEHGRGASAAKGALQSELHVSKKGDSAANMIVTLKTGKQKDDAEGHDLQFGLRVVAIDGEAKPDGRPVTSVVLESLDIADPATIEGTVEWLAARLDKAGIPVEYGVPRVRDLLPQMGIQASKARVEEAVRLRKQKGTNRFPEKLPVQDSTNLPAENQGAPGSSPETAGQTSPHTPGEVAGRALPTPPSPSPIPRDGEVGETAPDGRPLCTVCGTPMDPDWHSRGYDTHIGCDPRTN